VKVKMKMKVSRRRSLVLLGALALLLMLVPFAACATSKRRAIQQVVEEPETSSDQPAMEEETTSVSEDNDDQEEEEEMEEEEEEASMDMGGGGAITPPVAQDPRNETSLADGEPSANTTSSLIEEAAAGEGGGEAEWVRVDVDTFAQTMEDNPDAFLLDVRTAPEWEDLGYIQGAVLIPHVELADQSRASELPEDKTELILLYCGSGKRSQVAAETLIGLGFTNLQELEPGIKGWIAQGKPVEQV
jgi:rhodanese-related sulfurtransferase